MTPKRPNRARIMSFIAGATIICTSILGVGAATAAPTSDPTPPAPPSGAPSVDKYAPAAPLALEASSPKVKADFDKHLAQVKEDIRLHGGQILGEKKVAYQAATPNAAAAGVSPAASFPSGCGLYIIVYINHRTTSYSNVVGSSLTSCTFSTTYIQMDSILNKYDTYWGAWASVDEDFNSVYGASSLTTLTNFTCTTGNYSGFSGSTGGSLYIGSTRYNASACDGNYFWNCGN